MVAKTVSTRAKKKPLNINIKRIEGDNASVTLNIEWDSKTTPPAQQKKIWRGIATTLAAVMTREEAKQFLVKLATAKEDSDARAW